MLYIFNNILELVLFFIFIFLILNKYFYKINITFIYNLFSKFMPEQLNIKFRNTINQGVLN